jgi:hypothetical protein
LLVVMAEISFFEVDPSVVAYTPDHSESRRSFDLGGLTADQFIADIHRSTVGAGLPAMAALQAAMFIGW